MLSQTFCYWDKQQSADSNIIQFHFTLKCTKDQSSHFCDSFLVSKWIFQHHDRSLTKLHPWSEQPLVCLVINNSNFPAVKNNNTVIMHSGNTECRLEGLSVTVQYIARWNLSTAYVNQTNLNGELRKNWGAKQGANQKFGGPWPTQAPS